MKNNPHIAGFLNLIPGLGYIYLNRKRLFGWLILLGVVIGLSSILLPSNIDYTQELDSGDVVSVISSLVIYIAFVVDAYREAKTGNDTKETNVFPKPKKTIRFQYRTPTQHKMGLLAASIVGLIGVCLGTLMWANFYYNQSALLLLFTTSAATIAYILAANGLPYHSQAKQLLYVLVAVAAINVLTGFYCDAIKWYRDETGIAFSRSWYTWDYIFYYCMMALNPATWSTYLGELAIGTSAWILGSLRILRTAFSYPTPLRQPLSDNLWKVF
ncbi:hypothetical protein KBD11_00620 [Candidatus Saccharibacteria bacterium]|nr:hypothetical protein [Candidatus Saccharibacteria bacterium]